MREFWIVVFMLLTGPVCGQFEYVGNPEPSYADRVKQVIALEAKLESAQAKIVELEALVAKLKGDVPATEIVPAKIVEEMLVDRYGESVCPGCEAWWNGQDRRDLIATGWVVEKVGIDKALPGKLYPRWRVCIKEECGYIEYTRDFKGALQRYLDARSKR